jgi:hypothetical protein
MCDQCCENYNEFPAQIIGGGAGDYFLDCPVLSCKWAEYRVISIANSTLGDAQVTVSGDSTPVTLPYSGTLKTLSDQVFFRGQAYFCTFESGLIAPMPWNRITNSQKRVFARIDLTGGGACYITLQFRVRLLTSIPGPIDATHPDLGHQINIERAERVKKQLNKAGIPERFYG